MLDEGVVEGSLRPIDAEAVAYLMYQLGRVLVVAMMQRYAEPDRQRAGIEAGAIS